MSSNAGFPHGHLHAQVEEFRVSMFHLVFAQQGGHHLLAGRLKCDAQGFVFYVGPETFCVDFDGCLKQK